MSRRNDRVNELLRHEISRLLTLEINDPRLKGVISITHVTTSNDLRSATVHLSVMGDPAAKKEALEGIRSAATYLRRELRPRLSLRYTPFLSFTLDDSLEEAQHLFGIMDDLRETATSLEIRQNEHPGTEVPQERDHYTGPLSFPSQGG